MKPETAPAEALSEADVAFIEHTFTVNTSLQSYIELFGVNVPALCRSLRAAWARVDKFSTLADERHDLLSKERRANDSLHEQLAQVERRLSESLKRNKELRGRLVQVDKERDKAQRITPGNWRHEG